MDTETNQAAVAILLENHRAFLRYLEGRVGDRALAEDILQDAFAKVVARPDHAPRMRQWLGRNGEEERHDQVGLA